jgi:response regulator of citrate/malate metabolism
MEPKLNYLLVEDSLKVCEGIKDRIDDFPDWECCGFAHHVEEALESIRNCRPALVFLDWALKGGSAYEVLSCIKNLPQYEPYIIFNTGYQSENPEIPQEIINNYQIDKYLVKPLWEKLRLNLPQYLKEAALKSKQKKQRNSAVWMTDIFKNSRHINLQNLVCVQQHFENPYFKILHFNDKTSFTIKTQWSNLNELFEQHNLSFFITNSRGHLIIKDYIQSYKRPYVQLNHFKPKIEVVKNKLSAFEKWMKEVER